MSDTNEGTGTTGPAGEVGGHELPKTYQPDRVEPGLYDRWEAADVFAPDGSGSRADWSKPPFVIIQPPPNVTGALHLGHAQRATVEDALVRHARMARRPTLWLPGKDHASIAAQYVLDRLIADEGASRESLGRERYLERMWRFVRDVQGIIADQHRRIGASADWRRERFTMDAVSARAVRMAFRRLFEDGLAYRTEALINWCPGCRTSVSDLEVIPKPEKGSLWTIRYHLVRADGTSDPDAWVAVATTRPETLLGDTAVAVHPQDPRYRALVGRSVRVPFAGRDVPVVADDVVDREFGTGAVKITPAHDQDDYATGKRHGLAFVTVLDDEGRVSGTGTAYDGLDRYAARRRIVADLDDMGDLEGVTPHDMMVGHCQRSDDVVEPRLKTQWFLRTGPLAEKALEAVRSGRTRIVPRRFEKVYFDWLENIRDWNVSRQLWWGHRIPAWYCPDGHVTVSDAEAGPDRVRCLRTPCLGAGAGSGHLRHVVLERPVAVLHPGLAGRDGRSRPVLSRHGHGDRLRHHLLLGGPDDDAGRVADGRGAVPPGVPERPDPRSVRPEDVEDQGQRDRPAGGHRRARRGCAALRGGLRGRTRRGHAAGAHQARERAQLRQQALERGALRAGGEAGRAGPGRSARTACGRGPRSRRALDPEPGCLQDRCDLRRVRGASRRGCRLVAVRGGLDRVLRLVHRAVQEPAPGGRVPPQSASRRGGCWPGSSTGTCGSCTR